MIVSFKKSPRTQFLKPVTHGVDRCRGIWKHPGKRNNKIKILREKKKKRKKTQMLVEYTKPFEVNLSFRVVLSVLW